MAQSFGTLLGISCKNSVEYIRWVTSDTYPTFLISTLSGKNSVGCHFVGCSFWMFHLCFHLHQKQNFSSWLCHAQCPCPHSVQLLCFPQWGKCNCSPLFHKGRHEPDDLVRFNYVLLGMSLSNVPLYTLPIWLLAVPWTLYGIQVRPNFKGRVQLNKLRHKTGRNPGNHILYG